MPRIRCHPYHHPLTAHRNRYPPVTTTTIVTVTGTGIQTDTGTGMQTGTGTLKHPNPIKQPYNN